jgi:membrane-associated protease RseP (regulator of RpoE activity)
LSDYGPGTPLSGPVDPTAWVDTAPPPSRDRLWLHVVLFVATLATTTFAGGGHWLAFESDFRPEFPHFTWISLAINGLWYSITILAILGAHEAGHYFACRYYHVDASIPYFIPAPLPLTGTVGAFIRIRAPIYSKRVLFDVGVAGPIAGFIVTVPAMLLGLWMSRLVPIPPDFVGMELGEPLLFQGAAWVVWGHVPDGLSINLHPMAFAAWFGMLATALNLIPIGQFDGGHIAYAVFGRRAAWMTIASVGAAIGLSIYASSWVVWTVIAVVLLVKFGWRHPPTWDEHEPLDSERLWIALFALIMLIVCFTPAPISPMDLLGSK